MVPEGYVKSMAHLRRCAKPTDLPAHLKTQFMNGDPVARGIHTGKSAWLYILLGEVKMLSRASLTKALATVEGMDAEAFITTIPVPLYPPTCQVQAAMWSSQFWPTVYRKNNPLGPHPSMIARNTDDIKDDASVWMTLAHEVALQAKEAGIGEAIGAVIVQRERGKVDLVGIAGDARWHQETQPGGTGNPMAHAALRCISHVAQKLVRHERRGAGKHTEPPVLEYDSFQDAPLLPHEKSLFEDEHPTHDGYLCHGLELYLTHEPCVQCSMGILHSRMGKVIFANRMPLTGGLCSEDRGHGHPEFEGNGGGRGLGLFWRRELNWSMLAWEWEPADCVDALPYVDPKMHI
jgi:tRNA-specific adenosine deaminase 3